jgi:hypothetical protein
MRTTRTPTRHQANTRAHLDWTVAPVGPHSPCHYCGGPALIRHPITGEPCHKVCDDRHQQLTIPVD